jgi:hypothetical protein
MTNHWVDIKNADLFSSWAATPPKRTLRLQVGDRSEEERKAKLIVVDPRFTRTAAVADFYAPDCVRYRHRLPRRRHQLPAVQRQDPSRIRQGLHQRRLPDRPGFKFEDGLFSGYNEEKRSYGKDTWKYQMGKDGFRHGR